ncbi:DUF6443 domain-containing protein [Mucilaginibacter boryungensis]|uniref:RHS repeat-associated core domain-containing protein n=1 Tax=Mucilaginibacter boryungensis TaxID=768480 RepID=A0ABR9XM23_9SPHI|nr:DUF6443 domain-containing protein [Mucilaginibacter boryungensis]MBE9668265.1 RHS repeat-associated core domain-containing protein [Mucilaginibacter boryungensis]
MKKKLNNPVKLKAMLCLAISCITGLSASAQITLTGNIAPGEYHDKTSIKITPTSSFIAGPGQSVHLFIQVPECQPLATAPSNSQNYVVTYVPRKEGISNPASLSLQDCDVMTQIQYFDGLGRPIQNIQVKGSPAGNDVVQPMAYDLYGRETTKYLPYVLPSAAANNGSYQATAIADQLSFFNPTGSSGTQLGNGIARIPSPYALTNFEPSPLNRPVEQGAPGDTWQPVPNSTTGHTVKITYATNTGSEVKLWVLIAGGGAAISGANSGNYLTSQLYKTATTDENGNSTIEFKDLQGHVVCKMAQLDASTYLSTYYVYDDYGNLAYVIPPIPAAVAYPTSFTESPSDAVFSNYIYAYHYDSRNRLAEKKLPGKGWEHMVYNNIDQMVATQDAVQRLDHKYTFTKYDTQGRVIMTGELTDSRTHDVITAAIAPQTINWETPITTGDGYTTTASWPNSWNMLYTINYYDDYTFPGGSTYASTATLVTSQTKGLLTGTKVRNLVGGAMLLTEYYYDSEGRPRETIAQNNISGTDRVINDYNFTGQLVKATRTHNSSTLTNMVIVNEYTYDHMGRKLRSLQKTGAGSKVVISRFNYNEIGQLLSKQLHGTISGTDTTYLQKVAYTYNPRGWLSSSSAPLFAMQLKYDDADDGAAPQYNGNIGNQYWGTQDALGKHYTYTYDALNRLKKGISTSTGYSETGTDPSGIAYDYLGNILQLTRIGNNMTNNYTYNYFNNNGSNQLQNVSGLTGSDYVYDDNGNAKHDGRTGRDITYNYLNLPETINTAGNASTITYTYDATGNKLKRISSTAGVGTTDYDNGIVYDNANIFAQTEEGRVLNLNGTINYEYSLTDHLGNSRVTFDTSLGYAHQVQNNDYFPFGMEHANNVPASPKNEYLYNKKELQEELGQYDYGARFYDPVIGRWNSVDPLAEINRSWNPYAYVKNNPMRFMDPDGMTEAPREAVGADGLTDEQYIAASRFGGVDRNLEKQFQQQNKEQEENQKEKNDDDPKSVWRKILSMFGINVESQPQTEEDIRDAREGGAMREATFASLQKAQQNLQDYADYVPLVGPSMNMSTGMANHDNSKVILGSLGFGFDFAGGEASKVSGWVKKKVFNSLDEAIQKKIIAAVGKGVVAPTAQQGIVRLTATEAAETGYKFKIKILGKGGDIRIYGNPMENGHILFDKIMRH